MPVPRLISLDSGSSDFVRDVELLDRVSERAHDTVHVFYVRSGQSKVKDILANVVRI